MYGRSLVKCDARSAACCVLRLRIWASLAGTDTVRSSATYSLGGNVENLTLTGTSAINATGNTLNNVLTGNSGANLLTGLGGNDTLNGGNGNDTLLGNVGNDPAGAPPGLHCGRLPPRAVSRRAGVVE